MAESLRIFGILLHKSWMVRRRHWIAGLFGEILIPLGLILCVWVVLGAIKIPPQFETESHYRMQSQEDLIDQAVYPNGSVEIAYAPTNSFTDQLMMEVSNCFKNSFDVTGFKTEVDFIEAYRKKSYNFSGLAVIFDEATDQRTKHLSYKLRGKSMIGDNLYSNLPSNEISRYYIHKWPFALTQICLDKSFVAMKNNETTGTIPEMFIQRVPFPEHFEQAYFVEYYIQWYSMVLILSFMIPQIIEASKATSEKFVGINILMSMKGISNTSNLLSWVVSGQLFLTIMLVVPNLFLCMHSSGTGMPLLHFGNPLILFLVFAFYVAHILTFGIHVSAYVSKALVVTFVILITNILGLILRIHVLGTNHIYLAPYFGIFFPNILLYQAIDEMSSYEAIGIGVQWNNLFVNVNPATKIGGSMGMLLILSAIGTIFYFLLAIYLYAVNPGKYGVAKHPLFFLMCESIGSAKDDPENLIYDDMDDKYFEPTPAGLYTPGIQIRNLKKAYNIGFFNNEKVHALRGVSVDFYKGQITSLLGHNGAGKTTMMSILTGMISSTEGLVLINSKNLNKSASEILNDMGLCTQENMYFSSLTVTEQLEFFVTMKRKDASRSEIKENVKTLLQQLKLLDKKDALPNTLSGGQKRRLCLGMAIAGDPSTLILDEPTSGLDPESRRIIWDILLKMRGQKTILISTHDMEEADILGDRIAIIHTGQLRSYGTSLFMKKMIGQNNVEVTLSIEPWSEPEKIRSELHSQGTIVNQETNKVIIRIPNSPELPDSLDNLEEKKKELGVSGFSVSLISLEQVFLKMTQENDSPLKPHQSIVSEETMSKGIALHLRFARALLRKKMTYALKDFTTILIQIFMIFMALLISSLVLKTAITPANIPEQMIDINLGMYSSPEVLYTSYDKTIGDHYKSISEKLGGDPTEVTNANLDQELLRRGKEDFVRYNNYLIAAAEFNQSTNGSVANALYSEKAVFSLPISINLIWNSIVRNLLGSDYSIELSSQELPVPSSTIDGYVLPYIFSFTTVITFVLLFYSTISMFTVHPLRESSKGVKQLQKMTGVSGFVYWGTMFLFDLMVYVIIVGLLIFGFVCMDYSLGLQMFEENEILTMVLLLMLLAINALPLVYIFSFTKTTTSNAVKLLTCISMGIVTFEVVMFGLALVYQDNSTIQTLRSIQKRIFLLLPYVSFFHSQISFYVVGQANSMCRRLPNEFYDIQCTSSESFCCKMGCYNGSCEDYVDFFTYSENSISAEESFIYLCVTPILYFSILAVLESQFIQKMAVKYSEKDDVEPITDKQVQHEKSIVAQKIRSFNENVSSYAQIEEIHNGQSCHRKSSSDRVSNQVFTVYELRKTYKRVKAVKEVSFGVSGRECFGLLGVNGAGKSTTFRMMTGGEVPDHGMMYINGKDYKNNEKYFLSQMGYCPQHDAILKCLNSYEHLRLFARLRGIPEDQVENEVEAWIQRLNLTACALQPSGTYSGGNKRRLNIAMALIGNPNLVLMDEPTTGVDPGARRSLWNVIKSCQMAGQAVVLTSHSMEECEALCNRLAIMVGGKLVCIGASEELKQRFGAGYDIQIKMDPEREKTQVDLIKSEIPQLLNCVLTDAKLGYLMYHVAPTGTTWRKMYDVMNEVKSKYDCIEDFLVLSSSLEQLFLLFAKTANGNSNLI